MPKTMLDQMKSHGEGAETMAGFPLKYTDALLRLIWSSVKLANAVGKDASLMDVVAALSLEQEWTDELYQNGLTFGRTVADFTRDVGTVIFFAPVHTGEGWPRKMEFDQGAFQPPFTLEVATPSGPFRPVNSARVKLNENEFTSVEWPTKPQSTIGVELRDVNKIEFDLDGPPFGSVVVTVRGIPSEGPTNPW